jgi:hypothetical protein
MSRTNYLALWLLISIPFSSFTQETNAPAFGKGLFNLVGKDSGWAMNVGTRMQILAINNWDQVANSGLTNPEQSFLVHGRVHLLICQGGHS